MYSEAEIKKLYNDHDLVTFLKILDFEKVSDPKLRSILSTVYRSLINLELEINPIYIPEFLHDCEDSNKPQEQ